MKSQLTGLLTLLLLLAASASLNAQDNETTLRGPKNATSQYSGNVYGPIDDNDTLWRIANRYRQNPNLSVYQVMVAIYELNPTAFEQNNLNLLVDGATLKLPSERYVARIDAERAKQRAMQDEQAFAKLANQPGASLNNVKPPAPLVNQQDLLSTRDAIEDKITALDSQQAAQFDELRRQFAASLANVQTILDENRKLYSRVEQVNEDLASLRTQVESDVQSQMDEQTALQRQLLDMMLKEEAEREAEKQSSFSTTLAQPLTLIIGSGLITLLLVGGLITWLLSRGRKGKEDDPVAPVAAVATDDTAPVADIAASVTPNLDDTPELIDDELFNDDELLDDVLSNELEEALDDELESFADLEDDMLVPDDEFAFDDGDSELDQDELDSLFDGEALSDETLVADSDDIEGIDLSAMDAPDAIEIDDLENEQPQSDLASDDDIDALLAQNQPDDTAADNDTELPDPDDILAEFEQPDEEDADKPEIDIDELLEEETPEVLADLDDEDIVSEDMLDKIDREINDQNEAIDRLADTIVTEMEQLDQMADMLGDDDDDEEEIVTDTSPSPQGIQDLEALSDELDEIDIEDMENADEFNEPLSDELIADLQSADDSNDDDIPTPVDENEDFDTKAQSSDDVPAAVDDFNNESDNPISDDIDDPLTDELIAELEGDISDSADETDISQDLLADELLAEFGIHDDESSSDLQSDEGDSADVPELLMDETDALSEDLLAELESDVTVEADTKIDGPIPSLEDEDETPSIPDDALETDITSASTEQEAENTDPLSDALEEFDRQLMEDIPSLTGFSADTSSLDNSASEPGEEVLEDIDDFNLEQEVDGIVPPPPVEAKDVYDELDDVPGLDDWLTESKNEDHQLLDELEQADFDDLLGDFDISEQSEPVDDKTQQTEPEDLSLGNPDLDLNALLSDPDDTASSSSEASEAPLAGAENTENDTQDDYLDVETLMDSGIDSPSNVDEQPLDLDVSLSDFTGVTDDEDVIDIDKDAGQSANLDLARVYIEMEDIPAAKELLSEVINLGSGEQKEEAESLLAQLA
ncbi:FimV/HubP family polar landmark protein [Alteromonas sp. C1M14]|uniref:FimV/HubP family polar landmark protein n=1 Tax=Alteromonas sp. C1M14 TaxID=2841567 RepID=UPI001C0958CF|nr:FimV/HubP family polar landmark protein [Alteromonas sp. C1M14]MBU2979744.1 AAA family ATPase [Alteromonas sp. C1M14]